MWFNAACACDLRLELVTRVPDARKLLSEAIMGGDQSCELRLNSSREAEIRSSFALTRPEKLKFGL